MFNGRSGSNISKQNITIKIGEEVLRRAAKKKKPRKKGSSKKKMLIENIKEALQKFQELKKLAQAGSRAQWILNMIPANAQVNWLTQTLLKSSVKPPAEIKMDTDSVERLLQMSQFQARFY